MEPIICRLLGTDVLSVVTYRLTLRATDTAGNRSAARSLLLAVVRR